MNRYMLFVSVLISGVIVSACSHTSAESSGVQADPIMQGNADSAGVRTQIVAPKGGVEHQYDCPEKDRIYEGDSSQGKGASVEIGVYHSVPGSNTVRPYSKYRCPTR